MSLVVGSRGNRKSGMSGCSKAAHLVLYRSESPALSRIRAIQHPASGAKPGLSVQARAQVNLVVMRDSALLSGRCIGCRVPAGTLSDPVWPGAGLTAKAPGQPGPWAGRLHRPRDRAGLRRRPCSPACRLAALTSSVLDGIMYVDVPESISASMVKKVRRTLTRRASQSRPGQNAPAAAAVETDLAEGQFKVAGDGREPDAGGIDGMTGEVRRHFEDGRSFVAR